MLRRVAIIATGTIGGVDAIGVVAPVPASTGTATGAKSSVSGVFAGDTAQTQWGPVQVQITVSAGQITAATALQYPNGDRRSQSIAQQSIPYLIQQTLTTKSANVLGVSGASYTSDGWRRSLASARSKAGI